MASLIYQHCNYYIPSTISPSSHHLLKTLTPSKPTKSTSLSKTPISISSSNSHFFSNPSSTPSKSPSFHTLSPPANETPRNDLLHLLKLSVQYSDTQLNKAVHASILRIQPEIRLFNSLITTYLQLGHLDYARKTFESIFRRDVVSYTAMISGLAKSNCENEAVELFFEMRESGIELNEYTLVAILTASMRLIDFHLGSQIHAFSIKSGSVDCAFVVNALMGLYSKCGCFDFVVTLFDEMPNKDIASWNTIISCLVRESMYDRAFELFWDLLRLNEEQIDYFTISSILVACARSRALREGCQIHAYALKIGYGGNLSVNNALIEFYSKCGNLRDIEILFRRMPSHDIFTWTEMINVYMGFGLVNKAVDIFNEMPEKNSVSLNSLLSGYCHNGEGLLALKLFLKALEQQMDLTDFTLNSVLTACGLMMDLKTSEQIHAFVVKFGFRSNDRIEAALLDMCTRCGRMDDAEKMFRRLDKNDSIMLTSLICGYARNSEPEKAIILISNLQFEESNSIDEAALASILGVCGDLGFQKLGEQFHCHALKFGLFNELGVGNATVSLYSKCGEMEQAIKAFESMPTHDIISWNSLLAGHILNRQGDYALDVWKIMQSEQIQPCKITCNSIISAYRHTHSNLVEDCRNFFQSMKNVYQIEPNSGHYSSFISVLGYWGLLEEAEEVILKMPFEPNASVWKSLLNSCRAQPNSIIGKRAAKKILSMEPQDTAAFILKSNLYSASGRWQESELVREKMRGKGLRKFPARSWFIHESKVHSFFARDKSHSRSKDIYSALEILFLACLRAGYEPDTNFVLHEVEEHQKINFLLYHSGKLAAVYGILMTSPGKHVRVIKNIHLCGDCHTFLKFVSVVTKREIHVRDASGFHRFANGECSCKDHW